MSIYAIIDGSEPIFFSSNSGWADVCIWADELDEVEFEALVALTEHGGTEDVQELRAQLQQAMSKKKPEESVSKTLAELMDLIDETTESVFISNGESSESDAT